MPGIGEPERRAMRKSAVIFCLTVAAALAGALPAAAQSGGQGAGQGRPPVSVAEAQAAQAAGQRLAPSARRTLRWTDRGRWSLNFNLDQPVGREPNAGDVQAGAYYRLRPNVRVGATADLAERERDPARGPEGERPAPRIRLESIFRF